MQYLKIDIELDIYSISILYLFHIRSKRNKVFGIYSPYIIMETSIPHLLDEICDLDPLEQTT